MPPYRQVERKFLNGGLGHLIEAGQFAALKIVTSLLAVLSAETDGEGRIKRQACKSVL